MNRVTYRDDEVTESQLLTFMRRHATFVMDLPSKLSTTNNDNSVPSSSTPPLNDQDDADVAIASAIDALRRVQRSMQLLRSENARLKELLRRRDDVGLDNMNFDTDNDINGNDDWILRVVDDTPPSSSCGHDHDHHYHDEHEHHHTQGACPVHH
jgi:ABC-type nickel/cobalt efflux system permease component RcnA